MNNRLFVGITLATLAVLVILLLSGSWGGTMGPWMMGGWGSRWMSMSFMWLVPVGLVVLIVLGLIWLVRSGYGMTNMIEPPCPNCGFKPIFHSTYCPNCGKPLK